MPCVFTSCVFCQLPVCVEGLGSNYCLNRLSTILPVLSYAFTFLPRVRSPVLTISRYQCSKSGCFSAVWGLLNLLLFLYLLSKFQHHCFFFHFYLFEWINALKNRPLYHLFPGVFGRSESKHRNLCSHLYLEVPTSLIPHGDFDYLRSFKSSEFT